MKKPVFVSTSLYALAHQLGMKGAIEEFKKQLDAPTRDSLPVVRTIERLRHLAEVHLHVDGGATYIGMARSRAFHEAFNSGLPWITLDDDIESTVDVCATVLEVLEEPLPRLVMVPYLTRDAENPHLTCALPIVRSERTVAGAKLLRLPAGTAGGGFGFVGMNRLAMEAIVAAAPAELTWFDGGEKKRALFYEKVEDGFWYGEDTSFFRFRVPPEVSVEAVLTGHVIHGGVRLDLGSL